MALISDIERLILLNYIIDLKACARMTIVCRTYRTWLHKELEAVENGGDPIFPNYIIKYENLKYVRASKSIPNRLSTNSKIIMRTTPDGRESILRVGPAINANAEIIVGRLKTLIFESTMSWAQNIAIIDSWIARYIT